MFATAVSVSPSPSVIVAVSVIRLAASVAAEAPARRDPPDRRAPQTAAGRASQCRSASTRDREHQLPPTARAPVDHRPRVHASGQPPHWSACRPDRWRTRVDTQRIADRVRIRDVVVVGVLEPVVAKGST